MFGWVASLFGFQPIKFARSEALQTRSLQPIKSARPEALQTRSPHSLDQKNWPEGPQPRQHLLHHEPDGWAHSNWSWRSSGYVDCIESLHPRLGKAESRYCLGVLKCQGCGEIIRSSTKTKDMRAQLVRGCPDAACAGNLESITCEARTLHFVTEEDGIQYSVWKHTGSHCSHPCPPAGRRLPRSVLMPPSGSHSHQPAGRRTPRSASMPKTIPKATSAENDLPADLQLPEPSSLMEPAEVEGGIANIIAIPDTAWKDEMYDFSWSLFLLDGHLLEFSIGQYALFSMVPNGMLYPARVVSRDRSQVNPAWHFGNIYRPGDTPMSPGFSRPVDECMDALEYAMLNAARKSQVCFQC